MECSLVRINKPWLECQLLLYYAICSFQIRSCNPISYSFGYQSYSLVNCLLLFAIPHSIHGGSDCVINFHVVQHGKWFHVAPEVGNRSPEILCCGRAHKSRLCVSLLFTDSLIFPQRRGFLFWKNDTRSRKGEMNEWGWGCCGGSEMIFILTRQRD